MEVYRLQQREAAGCADFNPRFRSCSFGIKRPIMGKRNVAINSFIINPYLLSDEFCIVQTSLKILFADGLSTKQIQDDQ